MGGFFQIPTEASQQPSDTGRAGISFHCTDGESEAGEGWGTCDGTGCLPHISGATSPKPIPNPGLPPKTLSRCSFPNRRQRQLHPSDGQAPNPQCLHGSPLSLPSTSNPVACPPGQIQNLPTSHHLLCSPWSEPLSPPTWTTTRLLAGLPDSTFVQNPSQTVSLSFQVTPLPSSIPFRAQRQSFWSDCWALRDLNNSPPCTRSAAATLASFWFH